MNTKLTLTMEQSIIAKAKVYARSNNRSLSDLIKNYLNALTYEKERNEEALTPTVKYLKGSFTMPKNFDYKKELTAILTKKHIK
ncbi:MAG: DUF6364 family protein [Cytophagales bacterium]|nr:DUF6364 family protein [Cytophagales bacterium]